MFSLVDKIVDSPCVALDLGTANTRLYACGEPTYAEQPSLVNHVKDCWATGGDEYVAYLNSRLVSAPLRGGVVVDVRHVIELLRPMMRRSRRWLRQPISLACAPTDTSEKERKRLVEAVLGAGAAHVAIIPEPWAAAIGAGIDINKPNSQLLVDIGEGVTDLAVLRGGRLVYSTAVRTACHDLQQAIKNKVISRHRVALARPELERLTHEIDSGREVAGATGSRLNLTGIDIIGHQPREVTVSREEIVEAMNPVLGKILGMIENGIRRIPPWFAAEVQDSGLWLTGGGSCIRGIDRLLAARTQMAVHLTPDPEHAVINGAIKALHGWKEQAEWWKQITWPTISS